MGSILIISLALALATYGIAAQRGANLVKLDKNTLIMTVVWGALELVAALAGYGTGRWILTREAELARKIALAKESVLANRVLAEPSVFWVHVLAGLLLAAVGLRMILQALKMKTLLEHRMETVDIRADVLLSLRLCAQALFLGITCGLLTVSMPLFLLSVFVFSAVFAGIGYVSGRANGALFADQAVGIGGGLLCVLGIVLQIA